MNHTLTHQTRANMHKIGNIYFIAAIAVIGQFQFLPHWWHN